MRQLSEAETSVLTLLGNEIDPDSVRVQFLLDLEHCLVTEGSDDGSRVLFHIEGYERPPYRGQHAFRGKDGFPIEGCVVDGDGAEIDVSIFADKNDRLLELEYVKQSLVQILGPRLESFRLK
jgi:hypothetical protein